MTGAAIRREMVHRLRTLAVYIEHGGTVDWIDPPEPRGKRPKIPDRVTFSWTVYNVRAFNEISWKLIGQSMKNRGSR